MSMCTAELLSILKCRKDELSEIINNKNSSLLEASDGRIHVVVNSKKRVQYYYQSNNKAEKEKYISKGNTGMIRKYLQKRYDTKIVKLLEKELKCINECYEEIEGIDFKIKNIYSTYPTEVKSYVLPVEYSEDELVKFWESIPFDGKIVSDDIPVYITDKGERVRSKSELNIANALYKNSIPYKYECPLKLNNGVTIYPDFTILNIKKRKICYWEHRGMMDDREYAKHTVLRIRDYQKSNIRLGYNLVISEETNSTPLGTAEINKIIDMYF